MLDRLHRARGRRPWLGVHLLTYGAAWPEIVDAARAIDDLGFDALLTQDHLFATQGDPAQPFFEAWTTIAALAPQTRRVALGHLTGAAPFRNPGIVARMVTTVDHASDGRALLGMGAAWDAAELIAHGIGTDGGLGARIDRLDELLAIVGRILAGDSVTVDSAFHQLRDVSLRPLPLQERVPVILGSSGERKGLRVVARHADLWQTWITPGAEAEFRRLDGILADHCAAVGRDATEIVRVPGLKLALRDDPRDAEAVVEALAMRHAWTPAVRAIIEPLFWRGTPGHIAELLRPFAAAGADGLVIQASAPYDLETLRRFREEVVPAAFEDRDAGGGG